MDRKVIKINDKLELVMEKSIYRTRITVIDDKNIVVLTDMNTNEAFYCDYAYNKNYLIVYSRGCMLNQIPLEVERVYDIKNRIILDNLDEDDKKLLVDMLICCRGFYLETVLSFLNNDFNEESLDVYDFLNFVSGFCDDIDRDAIVKYIINTYPLLSKLIGDSFSISVDNYKMLKEEYDILWFHTMSREIKTSVKKLRKICEKL